jgi:Na+-driven multidrug efflux pump
VVVFRVPLIGIYAASPKVMETASLRLLVICIAYFLIALNNVTCGVMRGMGASLLPAIVCLVGICVFRVIWVETAFPVYRTYLTLLLSYPISWIITLSANIACLFIVKKRIIARLQPERLP